MESKAWIEWKDITEVLREKFMDNKEKEHRKWGSFLLWAVLLGLSALATVKVIFFGTDIDEQYGVTMAYRMACGDRMFLEMWEPHQTSGFLAAFLVKIFMLVTGKVDGLVLYLRIAGAVIQGLVSLFAYDTMKRYCSKDIAFVASVFCYNTMPKYSQIPEFANMLVWFSVLMFLCLMRFAMAQERKSIWLVLAGVCTSLLVLSYPSCILVVVPVCFGIWHMSVGKGRYRNEVWYLGTCAVCGISYLVYFLSHMTAEEFVYGLRQMMSDGSHQSTLMGKMLGYKGDLLKLMPHIMIVVVLALGLWILFRIILKRNQFSLLLCILLMSAAEQMYIWLTKDYYLKFPLLIYPILLLIGLFRYHNREQYGIDKENRAYQAAFWFGSVTALWILLAAFIASNVHIYESSEYMLIGFIASFGYLEHERKQCSAWWTLIVLGLFCAILFRKGYLMYYFYGKDTIFVTKQKALDGPLEGVYCRYMDGYDYNMKGLVIDQYIPRGSKVMYIGVETLIYLQGEYDISNFSTISTPYLNERMFTYWEKYPEKYPEYVIWDFKVPYESKPSDEVRERLLESAELLTEEEGIQIYRLQRGKGAD